MNQENVPVITLDGPSGSGKGTISEMLAYKLGWHFLDSGSLYRVLAYYAKQLQIPFIAKEELVNLALNLPISFLSTHESSGLITKIFLNHKDVTDFIRTPECGFWASEIAPYLEVRDALLQRQRDFRKIPGLVADGRDMGTIVFPDAILKFFLDADVNERAKRRYLQLQGKGLNVSLSTILSSLIERDRRDREREVAPLKPASDAVCIDSTFLSINEVFAKIWTQVEKSVVAVN